MQPFTSEHCCRVQVKTEHMKNEWARTAPCCNENQRHTVSKQRLLLSQQVTDCVHIKTVKFHTKDANN